MFYPGTGRYRWMTDSWTDMDQLHREMNRLFSGRTLPYTSGYPAINVWSSEEGALVMTEIPGIDPKGIDISVENDVLTVSGSRKPDELKEGESYHRQERSYGAFKRTIRLPFKIDSGKVDARYEKGILSIALPRSEEDKPRKIKIKAD